MIWFQLVLIRGTTQGISVPLDDYRFQSSRVYLDTELATEEFRSCEC